MNLMDLMIAIGVEDNASSALSGITGNAKSVAQSLGTGLATAAKVGTVAIAGITGGVGALTKLSIDGFSQYEQLAGGVETLFKNSADQIKAYSDAAYKTAGMSANEYMDTAIKSSAALIRSLNGDTAKAAEIANMAITDMADNSNKMGSSLQSLQNAYTGFSRGNFTMLDNLALGFSGTKAGMEELLATAKELTGIDYNIDSYADIVQAIHAVQEEMEITGTTAKEAAGTISGSMASAEAAWGNFLTGLADGNADLGQLTDNLVDSVITVADNLLPRIGQAVDGIITSFGELIGVDLSGVAEKVGEFGDKAIEAAKGIMEAFSEGGIFGVFGEITQMFQQVTGIDVSFLTEKFDAIGAAVGRIREAIGEGGFGGGITAFIEEFAGLTGVDISGFVDGIGWFIDTVSSAAPEILDSVGKGIQGILAPFQEHAGPIISAIGTAFREIVDFILGADHSWIASVGAGIGKVFEPILSAYPETIKNVKDGVKSLLGILLGSDGNALSGIGNAITTIFSPMTEAVGGAMKTISGKFAEIMEYAADNNFGEHMRTIANAVMDLFGGFTSDLGGLIDAAANAFSTFAGKFSKDVIDNAEAIASALSTILGVIKELSHYGVSGVTDLVNSFTDEANLKEKLKSGEITQAEYDKEYAKMVAEYDNRREEALMAIFESEEEELARRAKNAAEIAAMDIGSDIEDIQGVLAGDDQTLRRSAYINSGTTVGSSREAYESGRAVGESIADGVTQGIVDGLSSNDPTLRRGFQELDDRVRDINEINSPSRRYARIGKFMAQGISVGWLEGMKDVEKDITGSMDFSTGNVSFSESASGKSSTGMINSLIASSEDGGQTLNVNVYLDGELVARNQYGYLRNIAKQKGEPVNA